MANEAEKLDATDDELLSQVCNFASRKAKHDVYLQMLYSKPLSAPVLLVVAFGDQAMALQKVIMGAAVQDESELIKRPAMSDFLDNGKPS